MTPIEVPQVPGITPVCLRTAEEPREKRGKAPRKPAAGKRSQPGLERYHQGGTEQEWKQQSVAAFSYELSPASLSELEDGADPGHEKEQVHEPVVQEDGKVHEDGRTDNDKHTPGQEHVPDGGVVDINRTHPGEADGRMKRGQG